MDFENAARLGACLSKDYAPEMFRLLVDYRSLSASEAASRLNLHVRTAQSFLEALESMGCRVQRKANAVEVCGAEDTLRGVEIDMNAMPDAALALAVVAVAVLGVVLTFATSWLLSRTVLRGEVSTFNLELPPYRPPRFWSTIYTSIIDRTLIVLWRAVVFALPAGCWTMYPFSSSSMWPLTNFVFGMWPMATKTHFSSISRDSPARVWAETNRSATSSLLSGCFWTASS